MSLSMSMPTDAAEPVLASTIGSILQEQANRSCDNLQWLQTWMHPYFFITMQDEPEAVALLASSLSRMAQNRRLILVDREKTLIQACPNVPGSLYETLKTLKEREISYADFSTSNGVLPGSDHRLEVQRFEFDRKADQDVAKAADPIIPVRVKRAIEEALKEYYPNFDQKGFGKLLKILWLNNEKYIIDSPARRVAQVLWLYQQAINHEGIYLGVEKTDEADGTRESRLMFAVGNPPQKDFLLQTMEVFNRLKIRVKRAYCLTISNGIHPYFLATFYVQTREDGPIEEPSPVFRLLKEELYNTQILSTSSQAYNELVVNRVATGTDASLINAFIGFCHTNLAHNQPDRFVLEDIVRAFHNHPDIALQLVTLFRVRFDPEITEREDLYERTLTETSRIVENYNTGHRFLDEFRRAIFRCCLAFIRYTLKTNFFVPEKNALAFRLDPAYLDDLDREFTSDLPPERPFRVTYFFGRYGSGFHIGFSDIARGGWRTLITKGRDNYVTCANTLFRENYVLAHTQHLKNKDIYEGGSKMVAVLDAVGENDREMVKQRLYKLQYGFINAFLDIYVTENGRAKDPRVVDYYGEEEAIELGPDENMHDAMIELIARQAVKRGYILGVGIMSSKKVGINHKEFGVTSTGVVKFAEVTMEALGVDMHRDPFSVKLTGGPNGDVAGNAMRLLLERCPQVRINLIVDGTGALYDPLGADREELSRIVLKDDVEGFDPAGLHPGGFLIYRNSRRTEGMRDLYKKVVRTETGTEDHWISNDEFYREYNDLVFNVSSDLFIPAGGRPETIDLENCHKFFSEDGKPKTRAIVEGANSFITPEARIELQKRGVVIMRDASANKCGVISSSYEIIANLLLTEREFLANKECYVADVVEILNKRAEEEARLIFRRYREAGCRLLYTEISEAISKEINAHYARLFSYFQDNPQLCQSPLYRKGILSHLPHILGREGRFRKRIDGLPEKIKYAILASEIASFMVYQNNGEQAYGEVIEGHLSRMSPR